MVLFGQKFSAIPQNDHDDHHVPHPTQHYPPTYHASGSTTNLGSGPTYVPSPINQGNNTFTSFNSYDPSKTINTTNEHVLRPPKPDELGGHPRPSFYQGRTHSVAESTLSLYEFHQPKRLPINVERLRKYDWPILILCVAIFAACILFFLFGGAILLKRPDIRRSVFTKAAVGAAGLSLPFTFIIAAIVVERKVYEIRQRRKHVKMTISHWTKIPILTFTSILTLLMTIMWGWGAIGLLVSQMDYEPHSHRHLRKLDHWVGGDRTWNRGERLGAAIFTHEGGILQIPVILALASFALSILLGILSQLQLSASKPVG